MYYYQFDEFIADINHFSEQFGNYKPDIIVAIARGGVTFGHFLSEKLNLRELFTLNSIHYDDTIKRSDIRLSNIPQIAETSKVLVVDDIVDSGETMQEVMSTLQRLFPTSEFKSGALFYKKDAIYQPDFKVKEAHEWIHFFWNIN